MIAIVVDFELIVIFLPHDGVSNLEPNYDSVLVRVVLNNDRIPLLR